MNVLVLGGSKNIGYYAALRLLRQGATVTYLLRRTSVFDEDAQVQPYVKNGKAQLVSGDGLIAEDVRSAWQAALDAGHGRIDYVLSSIGGKPVVTSKGLVLDPPDLCTRSLINLFATTPDSLRAPENQPCFIVVTSSGITTEAHAKLPLALRLFYSALLTAVHADKLGMERVLAYSAGRGWATGDQPNAQVLHPGWENSPGLWREGELKRVVIIRPAMLTDGACRGDEQQKKGKAPYRALANDEMRDAYRVSRQDVAHFIVKDVLPNWSKWEGAAVNVAY